MNADGTISWDNSSKCLVSLNGNTNNGNNTGIWDCSPSDANQQWYASGDSIKWKDKNKCLVTLNGNDVDGNGTGIWDCNDSDANQKWSLT